MKASSLLMKEFFHSPAEQINYFTRLTVEERVVSQANLWSQRENVNIREAHMEVNLYRQAKNEKVEGYGCTLSVVYEKEKENTWRYSFRLFKDGETFNKWAENQNQNTFVISIKPFGLKKKSINFRQLLVLIKEMKI